MLDPIRTDEPVVPSAGRGSRGLRWGGWLLLLVAVGGAFIASIAVGSTSIPFRETFLALVAGDGSADHLKILEFRLPRTVLALIVGTALGAAGALMQAMTRNPLADPGILGVNAGAMFGVVIGVGFAGAVGVPGYRWWSLAGAALATVAVYVIGTAGARRPDTVRLTLAGVALGAVLLGIVQGLSLLNPDTFSALRSYSAGSVAGRDLDASWSILPLVGVGLLLALIAAPLLNVLVLGDDLAQSLGVDPRVVRGITIVAVTLLAGAATAAAGPISFVGLIVAHVVRPIVGADQRWVLAYAAAGGALLLLVADILGRFALPTGELAVGVMTAFLGAPVLIALARRGVAQG